MKHRQQASLRTWGLAVATVVGLATPVIGQASLAASSSTCLVAASNGTLVGRVCADGTDRGQSTPESIPGGSGVGSGVIAGGSSAGALQDYGVFHGYAKAAASGIGGVFDSGGTSSDAQGVMSDNWVISGGTGFGYLTLAWTITGQTALDGHTGASAYLIMDVQTSAGSQTSHNDLVIYQGGTYTVSRVPFFFNQPLGFSVSSLVHAGDGYEMGGGPYAYYAAADFGHTSILSGIDAYGADGHHIDGITISSASGARYPVMVNAAPGDPSPPSAVPEPAVGALLLVGAVAAGSARRRRGSSTGRRTN